VADHSKSKTDKKTPMADQDDDHARRGLPDYGSESQFENSTPTQSRSYCRPLETSGNLDNQMTTMWLMSTDSTPTSNLAVACIASSCVVLSESRI